MIVWLVFLIVGAVVTGVSSQSQESIQEFCDGDSHDAVMWLTNGINTVDNVVNSYSGELMCSYDCPCATESIQPWLALSESELQAFNRSRSNEGSARDLH